MKKRYEKPELQVIPYEKADILTGNGSGLLNGGAGNQGDGDIDFGTLFD